MFKNVTQAYNLSDASWEILIMLAVAFLLGLLFYWAFLDGECPNCNNKKKSTALDADDLKIVEGIGPKIEELLNHAGIYTFEDLAETETSVLQKILDNAGPRFKMHNPSTWAKQSELASKESWDELKEYQDFLVGGKDFA